MSPRSRELKRKSDAKYRAKRTPEQIARQAENVRKHLADPENRERHKARSRAWFKAHPSVRRAAVLRYRGHKAGNGGKLTAADWRRILEAHGHKCAFCGVDGKLEADHIVPVSKGGPSDPENIQPLCRRCNVRKGNRVLFSLKHGPQGQAKVP